MFSANTSQVAAGGGASNYIEDVFSTWLYTGNSTDRTITNNIDLSTKKGLVWIKSRSNVRNHVLADNVSNQTELASNLTTPTQGYGGTGTVTSFNTNGFSLGTTDASNGNGFTFASWTFRKQPKFFDVVTYSGSNSTQTISHNLGSTPGCIMIKKLDSNTFNAGWAVYHRSLTNPNNYYLVLNTTAAETNYGGPYISSVTSTTFTVAGGAGSISLAGSTYVAYLFAHDAGGFGLTGTDNVISCGTFTTDGSSNATITLGYEPQWVLTKRTDGGGGAWGLYDTMRGWSYSAQNYLLPNDSGAEGTINSTNFKPTATGFTVGSPYDASATYIYITIRRGPMKVPTSGTSVFAPVTQAGGGFDTAGFPVDLLVLQGRNSATGATWTDRLRGSSKYFNSSSTGVESSTTGVFAFDNQTGVQDNFFGSGTSVAYWNFRRAPSFFDEVCYTGTGTYGAANHNLGVTPELVIYKSRSNAVNWGVIKPVSSIAYYDGILNSNSAFTYYSNDPSVAGLYTSTQFCKYQDTSSYTYVAYLFATCAGVSKVGSYTGNGSTQTINCGFTGGARFVLIKRTDSTGDWYVYDTARGMTVLTDPYLLLNSTAAESATLGSVTTVSTGFALNSSILAAINVSGGSYIFFAVA